MDKSTELIELLTWASIELTKPGVIDKSKLATTVEMALMEALKAQQREMNAKTALLRTSKVMGV